MVDIPKFDRRLNVLLTLSILLVVGILIFAFVAVPRILSTDSATTAIDKGNAVTSCRANYRTSLVDERTANLFIAKARLDEATNAGLEATVRGDDATLEAIVGSLADLRQRVDAAALALEHGITTYRDLVTQSGEDVDGFLAGCA